MRIIDFPDEEDVLDFEADAEFMALAEEIEYEESKIAMVSPTRTQQFHLAYKIIEHMVKDMPGVKLTSKEHEPYKSCGCITIEAKSVVFTDIEMFQTAAKLSNTVDIYPLVNGNLRIEFGFTDLTVPIE